MLQYMEPEAMHTAPHSVHAASGISLLSGGVAATVLDLTIGTTRRLSFLDRNVRRPATASRSKQPSLKEIDRLRYAILNLAYACSILDYV